MSTSILQISPAYKPSYIYGGPTMSVAKLCEALVNSSSDIELSVLTTTANGPTELPVEIGKPIMVDDVKVTYYKRITKDHTHFSPQLFRVLKQLIVSARSPKKREKSAIVVHIHAWWNLISLFSCAIARFYRVPVILSPRGMLTDYTLGNRNSLTKSAIHLLMGKGLLKYCHIHATSEQEKEDVLKIVVPKSITVIPNLVNLPEKAPVRQKLEARPFKLIFLSRIEEKKGLELLLEALSDVGFDFSLTIAGSGEANYLASLKAKAEVFGIAEHIEWAGHVDNDRKFDLLAQHDLMVLTSYNENFANVVVESLWAGTAVLLSSHVGLSDYVNAKNLGWISDLSISSIREKLTTAFHQSAERNMIRETSPSIIAHDFSTAALTPRYLELYTKAIN
ncbi:MAG: glycosyltransferase [Pedobacter sp.]|nr:glycosyltransferase [Pedobacter sp.]